MTLISAFTLIRTLSIFHLTLAYYFLTSPRVLADQSLVFLLGESMGLPPARGFDSASAPAAALAMLLALIGASDLVAVSLPDDVARYLWGALAPIRLLFFFAVPAFIFIFKPDGLMAGTGTKPSYSNAGANGLGNGLVFTWAFVEMVSWFWIYTSLREEGKSAARRRQ